MPNRVTLTVFSATLVLAPDIAAQQVDTTFVTVHGHRRALWETKP